MRERTKPRLISVVVPARDAAGTLAETLAGLARLDHPGAWEAIVVDDASSDGTGDLAREAIATLGLPGGRVVPGPGRGPGAARNAGARAARGELLAFADADDVPEPGWLSGLAGAAAGADLVAGALHLSALNSRDAQATLPSPPFQGPLVGMGFLGFASGSNCAVWRAAFDSVGGFDEDYPAGEDIELSWRLQLAGFDLAFAQDAVIQRRLKESTREVAGQEARWGLVNVRLYADYREHGVPGPDMRRVLRDWRRIVVEAPAAMGDRARRLAWARRLGRRCGQLAGSVRHRVLYP